MNHREVQVIREKQQKQSGLNPSNRKMVNSISIIKGVYYYHSLERYAIYDPASQHKISARLYSTSSAITTTTSVSATSVTPPGSSTKKSNDQKMNTQPPFQKPNKKPDCIICKIFKNLISKLILFLLIFVGLLVLAYIFKDDIYNYLTIASATPEFRLNLINFILNLLQLCFIFVFSTLFHLPNYFSSLLDNSFIFNYLNISNDDDTTTAMTSDNNDLSIDTEINNILFSESNDQNNNMDVDEDLTNNMDVDKPTARSTNYNMDLCEAEADNQTTTGTATPTQATTAPQSTATQEPMAEQTNTATQAQTTTVDQSGTVITTEGSVAKDETNNTEEEEDEDARYMYTGIRSSSSQTEQAVNNTQEPADTPLHSWGTQAHNASTTANTTATETTVTPTSNEDNKATHSSVSSDHTERSVGAKPQQEEESTNTQLIGTTGCHTRLDPFSVESTLKYLEQCR